MPGVQLKYDALFDTWAEKTKNGQTFEVKRDIERVWIKAVIKILWGLDQEDGPEFEEIYNNIKKLEFASFDFVTPYSELPFTPCGQSVIAKKKLLRIVRDRLGEIMESCSIDKDLIIQGRRKPKNMPEALIMQAKKEELDLDYLADSLEFIFGVAALATKASLNVVIDALANNPGVQDKVIQEQLKFKDKKITGYFSEEEPYTNAFHDEAIRHFLMNLKQFNIRREISKDFVHAGYLFKKGYSLQIPTQLPVHKYDDIEDLLKFRPERWIEQRSIFEDTIAAFGHGIHSCIGKTLANAVVLGFV